MEIEYHINATPGIWSKLEEGILKEYNYNVASIANATQRPCRIVLVFQPEDENN